jgi:hypothetical protein
MAPLNPAKLQQAFSEIVLMLLGALLIFLAARGMLSVERHSPAWIAVGALVVYRGVRSFMSARTLAAGKYYRWEEYVRGGSLLVVGAIILSTASLPPFYLGPLLGTAGAILILRGLANALLSLRTR